MRYETGPSKGYVSLATVKACWPPVKFRVLNVYQNRKKMKIYIYIYIVSKTKNQETKVS